MLIIIHIISERQSREMWSEAAHSMSKNYSNIVQVFQLQTGPVISKLNPEIRMQSSHVTPKMLSFSFNPLNPTDLIQGPEEFDYKWHLMVPAGLFIGINSPNNLFTLLYFLHLH